MRTIALATGVLLATSLLAGCGSGDDAEPHEDSSSAASGGSTDTTKGAEAGECATSLTATYPDGTEAVLDTTAQAAELGDGTAYTFYVGDYEIPDEGIGVDTVLPPEGSRLAVVFLTAFNATSPLEEIAPGTTVEVTDELDVLTFSTILYAGGTAAQSATDATGELTVVAVDDSSICVELDYDDAEKSLSGRISAPIHDSPY
ncbi:hypothetical protein ACFQ0K_14565 [Nocardioides caeni]|uniref:Uncharacterized protein n=1 Tax=Nocardioides caeni TaxID=574700 RepID=A0A4S8NDG7_9ACTN|nr:hypothetical protein [Nocardioides caeni]THV14600.1 hypothetical protein E9934_07990 [Nocardioides caeni]